MTAPDDDRLELTDAERHSALWLKIAAHLEDRVARLRRENDDDRSLEATARLRGRLAEAKRILAAGESQDQ